MTPFDDRLCKLGEGPLWEPDSGTLYWFDIMGKRLLSHRGTETHAWQFDRHFSAAARLDAVHLLLASEDGLWRFDIATGALEQICELESDNPVTRSNDGRADPWGGFWIGTMGKDHEPRAGAIYRYFAGNLRRLVGDITVSNAICFAPDKSCAYFTDTVTQKVMRLPLADSDGWPAGEAEVLADLAPKRLYPDGAVTDSDGNLWVACWGACCIICLGPDGTERRRIDVPARQVSCPSFGGPNLRDLFVTTARIGLRDTELEKRPLNGATFVQRDVAQGLPEPKVIL